MSELIITRVYKPNKEKELQALHILIRSSSNEKSQEQEEMQNNQLAVSKEAEKQSTEM